MKKISIKWQWTYLIIIGTFFFSFLFWGWNTSFFVKAQTKKEAEQEVDIEKLSKDIMELGEKEYPKFSSVFDKVLSMQFAEAVNEIGQWFFQAIFQEIQASKILIGELLSVIIFSVVFSNISSSFQIYGVSDSGFFVSYLITFTIIFANFTAMTTLLKNTVLLQSSFLKIVLPVYTLVISLSGNLSTGVVFYEYFIIVVLLLNWCCIHVFLPMVQYNLLLELMNHFSEKQNISKLCVGIYFLLSKGIQVLFFVLFGFHLLETMIAPSFDMAKNTIINKMIGIIPGAGTIVQSVTGTVLSSSIMIKNTLGVTTIIFLFIFLSIPLIKLLCYVLFYFLLSVVLEPIADQRLVECISAAVKCGILVVRVLCMSTVLFIIIIALTALTTNNIG